MFVVLFLIVTGLSMIVTGLSFHLGYLRIPIVYWTTFTSSIYSAVPGGVGMLLLGLGSLLPSPQMKGVFLVFAISSGVVGIIMGLTMPQFLTPRWFRFLRENYDDIMPILLKDAADNYSSWKEHTKTQEGLEAWAAEVRAKTRL